MTAQRPIGQFGVHRHDSPTNQRACRIGVGHWWQARHAPGAPDVALWLRRRWVVARAGLAPPCQAALSGLQLIAASAAAMASFSIVLADQ
jgi:hypothetical protein